MANRSMRSTHHRRRSDTRISCLVFSILLSLAATIPVCAMSASSAAQRLAGQRVLVTGAGRGIGQAIALICSREGAQVAAASRTMSELEETKALSQQQQDNDACHHDMDLFVADVTNQSQVEHMVQSIVDKWGGIDILINNAGRGQKEKGPSQTLDSNELQNLMNLNVVGVHMVTSSVVRRAMLSQKEGRIINISSRAGKVGLPNYSFYVASKFALEGMSASMAEEWKDHNIAVSTLSPGMVDTKSFPKPQGKKGVRTAESVENGLMALLLADKQTVTGRYLHVDEHDEARAAGLDDNAAFKPIREPIFDPQQFMSK